MPRERFKFILRYLRFDNYSSRLERLKTDKLTHIRFVFENIKSSLFKYYSPGTFLTVDERLARYRGKCSFRQFIQSKPGKYGIKLWIIADARTFYPVVIEVYVGKQQLSNKTDDLVFRLSDNLRAGHVIIGDNYFTYLKLNQRLLTEKKILYLGLFERIGERYLNS